MDTKQANLTGADMTCLFGTTTQRSVGVLSPTRVTTKAAPQLPFMPCSAAGEMRSQSLWKSSRMTLRINKKQRKKKKKKQVSIL